MDKKISAYDALTAVATDDELVIVDKSDTTMGATGTTKKITQTNLIPDSSATVKGKVELATNAETLTGTDTERAVTPDDLLYVLKNAVYPVGSIYINAGVDTNPATLLGFGTWVAFGAGRVMVGQDTADADFDTLEEEYGAKAHTLTGAQSGVPAHAHPLASGNGVVDSRSASISAYGSGTVSGFGMGSSSIANNTAANASQAHNNVQPSIVVKMWKRTA